MGKKYTADTFEGAVTGTASGNVAKTGDTMSGNLTISKSNALLTVFDSDTSGSVPAIRLQARTVMDSNIPIYLTSDENQDFAIRESSINSTNYADTTVGNLSVVRNDAGEAQLSVFSNNNTQTTSRAIFKVKNPMSSTPFTGNLIFSNGGYTFENNGNTLFQLGSSYHYTAEPIRIGANSSANALDDYEEGTWIPNLTTFQIFGSPLITNQSYTFRTGTYTKIGNVVRAEFGIELSATITYTNRTVLITGLPFNLQSQYKRATGNINTYDKLNSMDKFAGLGFQSGFISDGFMIFINDSSNTEKTRSFLTSDLAQNISSMTPIRIHGSIIYSV